VVLALDLVERIAHRLQEISVGGDDRAIHVEFDNGLRLVQRSKLRVGITGEKRQSHFNDSPLIVLVPKIAAIERRSSEVANANRASELPSSKNENKSAPISPTGAALYGQKINRV